ncbi:hypothetical protein ABB37_02148 [Leptomonas pyrrhocoris]|uniref:Uncharacterized protein n=1 Tax=Leptomonas pyrrhocoris TaxID=157538 RepID=A0A0N0DYE0_LEPPY|nr:hypothetical protein ABB37_02148 [Leptomonas pyrrhocoris]XP_015662451.1 hypothetical protein ABB37_02148 [Leptomonas pyrrhocoris]KPA84011.1 hypothetical protein ABB37_02148 [Leptomonas pyrrhocoris]KPA84012.1 hypothetical protein ABB37_02148 [Leptomonas pyrrhocoris]|eukprot:XP_015662450.1 hypothetical protein ABB37_02148 [Leptomonas pyrrhocoris]
MQSVKPRKVSSFSFSSLSDRTHDFVDDPAGITRSSLTQESCQNDSGCHTWESSIAGGSVLTLPLHAQTWVQLTPGDAPVGLRYGDDDDDNVRADLSKEREDIGEALTRVKAHEAEEEAVMDVFDLALEADVEARQDRPRHHHHRHHHRQRRRRHHASLTHSNHLLTAVAGDASRNESAVNELASAAAVVNSKACTNASHTFSTVGTDAATSTRHSRVSKGCQATAPLSAASSTAIAETPSIFSGSIPLCPEARLQHLKMLLSETRSLHEAFWKQLQDLQRQEAKETQQQRKCERHVYTA